MSLTVRSHNGLVDVFIDTDATPPVVVGYAAKGGEIIRSTVAEAEADALAGRLNLEEEPLPGKIGSTAIHRALRRG